MTTKTVAAALISLCLALSLGCKEDGVSDEAKQVANDVSRTATKAAHRVEEATCVEGDVECLALKARNRITEAADATGDAVEGARNKLD